MAEEKPASMHSKFSSRVIVLKPVLESEEWVGRRVLVGGWVKSSKEVIKKESETIPTEPIVQTASAEPIATRDVSCSEMLQTKIPFIRSIIKIFGGNTCSAQNRFDVTTGSMKPRAIPPSTLFLQIGDGSCASSLLVVVESLLAPPSILLPVGTCLVAEGELKQSTFDAKHAIELRVEKIHHIGTVESDKYPLSKKRVPLNSLREFPHLRPRTTTVATIMRIRSALSLGAHTFPKNQGFLCVQLPVLTSRDSIEAEKFDVDSVKSAAREKSKIVEELKRTESNKEALVVATEDLRKTLELASRLEAIGGKSSSHHLPISGRLHLESYACCLRNVYDFGPRFRRVETESPKQIAEMWTVEIEMAFSELEDAMNCAEDFFKFLCRWVLETCSDDMKFVLKRMDRTSVDRLRSVVSSSFERITYTEALNVLKKMRDTKKVETKLEWGLALTTEQLSFLAEEVYKSPVIIYNYPKQVKPFYARLNSDKKTVAAFDIIVPKIGTLVSGSQNEERLSVLSPRLKELGLVGEEYERYLDLRRHGTVNHSGFSFAFDLMVLFATGLADVRDVIPFPITHAKLSH